MMVKVFCEMGKIVNLEGLLEVSEKDLYGDLVFESYCGIAYTRWVMYGLLVLKNLYLYMSDEENDFLVVYNGIIMNYQVFREMLQWKGYMFESDTDIEVILKLIKYLFDKFYDKCLFRQLVMEVLRQLYGVYVLVFKLRYYLGELVVAKRGSSLFLGIVEGSYSGEQYALVMSEGFVLMFKCVKWMLMEFYFVFDVLVMVEYIKCVLYLEDDDVAYIYNGGYGIYRMEKIYIEGEDLLSLVYVLMVKFVEVECMIEMLIMEVE